MGTRAWRRPCFECWTQVYYRRNNLGARTGVGLSLIGSSHESIKSVPQLKFGPIQPGLQAGIKGQVFLTFRNGVLLDWGGLFEAELDLLGIAKEFKTGYTIGM